MSCDVAIVGAGPAGSSAARRAAQLGMRVVLCEKAQMPRFKLCGGALSEQAMSYLDFPVPSDLVDRECYGGRVHYRESCNSVRLDRRIAVLVSRERFDLYLVQKAREAGVEYRLIDVIDLEPVGKEFRVIGRDESFLANSLIIAQGASGRLITKVRPPDEKGESAICLEHRFPVTYPDRFGDLQSLIDIYFGVAGYGYGWVFHHRDYYSVGVGGLRSRFPNPLPVFHQFCQDLGFESQGIVPRGHPVPRGGVSRKIYGDRILLAGDAAGFVDAFYGEGIAYAIRSGQLAAETIAGALAKGDLSERYLERYSRLCDEEFGRNLRYSLNLSRLAYGLPGIFLRLLSSDPFVLRKFLRVPLMELSYAEYIGWLMLHSPWLLLKTFRRQGVARKDTTG